MSDNTLVDQCEMTLWWIERKANKKPICIAQMINFAEINNYTYKELLGAVTILINKGYVEIVSSEKTLHDNSPLIISLNFTNRKRNC